MVVGFWALLRRFVGWPLAMASLVFQLGDGLSS